MSKTQKVVTHIQNDEIMAEQLSYFSLLTSQALAEVSDAPSPLTSHPILSISAIHSTTPGLITKCFTSFTFCGSNASLPLISRMQGQRLDGWPYTEWPSPVSLSHGRGDFEGGVSHHSRFSLPPWWQVTHSIDLWSMDLPHLTWQAYAILHNK